MLSFRRFSLPFYPVVLALMFTTIVLVYQLFSYDENNLIEIFRSAYHQGTDSFMKIKNTQITKNQLVFPYKFPVKQEDLPGYINKNPKTFNLTSMNKPNIIKYSYKNVNEGDSYNNPLTSNLLTSKFKKHNITLFHSSSNIQNNLKRCNRLQTAYNDVQINEPINMQVSLTELLTKLKDDVETNSYLAELSPFFINELELQLKHKVVDRYWYRLAGSSVWLEQYGVHFMISRILYSPKGFRNQPILSFTYAQIFDENWKELVNTKLVIPTNSENAKSMNDDAENKKVYYKTMSFPQILPIPFWHDYDNTDGKYYGPEDPRILLVKNSRGYEEPLIIFNAYHRKLSHFDDDSDHHILVKTEFYRSMFMCWPWQSQRAKENTDGLGNSEYDDKSYSKVVELRIKNLPRQKKQKNWTPFISYETRHEDGGYDSTINFIYRWANLEILKCDLVGDSGICSFTYRLNPRLNPDAQIGPLRGGTQLMNVKQILEAQGDINLAKIIPHGREVWVGFARAHLDKCGCGNNMYRPNLVILVKDTVDVDVKSMDGSTARYPKDFYRLSHVSSSISFDIPIIGWDLSNPKDLCLGSNVLIPNGISSWSVKSFSNEWRWELEDYLTLSLSISDFTVHRIDIKGLLSHIVNDKSLFYSPLSDNRKKLGQPNPKMIKNHDIKDISKRLTGFNNDNVLCGLDASANFCAKYGEDVDSMYEENQKIYDELEISLSHAKAAQHQKEHKGEEIVSEKETDEEIETDIDRYEKELELQNIENSVKDFPSKNNAKKGPSKKNPKKSPSKKASGGSKT